MGLAEGAFVESEVEYFSEDDQKGRGPLTDGLEVDGGGVEIC